MAINPVKSKANGQAKRVVEFERLNFDFESEDCFLTVFVYVGGLESWLGFWELGGCSVELQLQCHVIVTKWQDG